MAPGQPPLILGSASPRRADLLAQLDIRFTVLAADIDETPAVGEAPRDYVQRMAREKAAALSTPQDPRRPPGQEPRYADVLLTADTTVVLDGVSFGKPRDVQDARQMLASLSGRWHDVYTALCVCQGAQSEGRLVHTAVEFAALTPALINAYLATEEPWDKAGAYALQGRGGSFVRRIDGSVSNVIGLPLVETRELLALFAVTGHA